MKKAILAALITTSLFGCGSDDVKDKLNEVKDKVVEKFEKAKDLTKQGWDCEDKRGGEWDAKEHSCELRNGDVIYYKGDSTDVIEDDVPAAPLTLLATDTDQERFAQLMAMSAAPVDIVSTLTESAPDAEFYVGNYEDGSESALIMLTEGNTVGLFDVTKRTARFLRVSRDASLEWSIDLRNYAGAIDEALTYNQYDLFSTHIFDDVIARDIEGNEVMLKDIEVSYDFGPLIPLLESTWLYQ